MDTLSLQTAAHQQSVAQHTHHANMWMKRLSDSRVKLLYLEIIQKSKDRNSSKLSPDLNPKP